MLLATEQLRCCLHVNVTACGCPSLAAPPFPELNRQPAQTVAEVGTCIRQQICKCWLCQLGCLVRDYVPHTL